MKKILILFTTILLVCCCNSNKKIEKEKIEELNSKLMQYAKEIFETEAWTKGGIKEGTYTVTLKDLKEKILVDVSDFKNPITNKLCDMNKTKIDFIVSRQLEPEKTNYKIETTVDCGQK
jgi:hypothetical protein